MLGVIGNTELGEADASSLACLYTSAESNFRDCFGLSRKAKCYCFARQRGTQWTCPLKLVCLSQGGLGEELYSNDSRVGLLRRAGGCAGPAPL